MAPHLPCSKPQTSQLFLDRCGLGPSALPCHCPSFPGLQPQGQNEYSPNLKASPGLPTSNTEFYHLGWSSLSLGRVGWTGRWEEPWEVGVRALGEVMDSSTGRLTIMASPNFPGASRVQEVVLRT